MGLGDYRMKVARKLGGYDNFQTKQAVYRAG
jgi:hypothetical protein